jgi:hypothetical protein
MEVMKEFIAFFIGVVLLLPAAISFGYGVYCIYHYWLSRRGASTTNKWTHAALGMFVGLFPKLETKLSRTYFNRAAFSWLFCISYIVCLYLVGMAYL